MTWMVIGAVLSIGFVAPGSVYGQAGGAQLTITGTGTVRIDGAVAATGATIFPGSRVSTASGVTAVVTSGGSRVTLNPDTDAVVTYAGGFIRADVICGSASGAPAAGNVFEMITHGDTSVYVQGGTVQVAADGKNVEMVANQSETFAGGVKITTSGGSVFDASSILCSCLCAVPRPFPVIAAAGTPLLLLLLLGAAAAAATTTTIILTNDDDTEVISAPFP
jgi:hypothetical protein